MNKPIIKNIQDLTEAWIEDSKMDLSEPAREMARIPNLHSKYLAILAQENLIIKKLEYDYNKERKFKWEYYHDGIKDPKDLESRNLEPINRKILRQDINVYLDSDEELQNIKLRINLHQEMAEFCKTILQELKNRTFQVNGIIKWELFANGAG